MPDFRLAVRLLARTPGFAAIALLTLALGIGAPTAIFSVVNAVLIRPLPYPRADRLVRFSMEAHTPRGVIDFDAMPVSEAIEWSAATTTLQALSVFNESALTLFAADGPHRLQGIAAQPNVFDVLGVRPQAGRLFDANSHDRREIVISHEAWRRYFAGAPGAVGATASFDGEQYRVIGIMPAGFAFPSPDTEFWTPFILQPGAGRGMLLPVIGRLRDDASVAGAIAEGSKILGGGDPRDTQVLRAETMQDQLVGPVRRTLWMLMAAVSLVSLVATTNIALLLLTRGAGREREFSIRLAIGASRSHLVRQLFVEGAVLATLGGTAGLLLAWGTLHALLAMAPANLPRVQDATLDGAVLAFALTLTIGASLLFGLLSAARAMAIDPLRALTGATVETRLVRSAPSRRRLNALAGIEIAVTMVLLVGAGLLLRSFVALALVDQGFAPNGALAFHINLPEARYPGVASRLSFYERLIDRLRASGYQTAGLITTMPNREATGRFAYDATGLPDVSDPMTLQVSEVRMVSDGFFEAMGVPVLAGRTFTPADAKGAEPVMVISRALAEQQFHDRDPIGQMLYSNSGSCRVIGVVGDVRPANPSALNGGPAAYLPLRQQPDALNWLTGINIVVRGGDRGGLERSMRALVLSLDPQMPTSNVRWLDDEVASLVAAPRFSASILGIFASVALVLAAIGVYGVAAHSMTQRRREIGVRVALGATRAQVLRTMIRDAAIAIVVGLAAGAVAAIMLARTLTGLLHDVTPADPASIATVSAILLAAGLVAAYVPARRATRLSALEALRE